jgi:MFS-type transporter involved in bile tolerance (Atg22 family)
VAAYALMAAGGDLGASLAPQLQGIVVDVVAQNTTEQVGMRAGMLVSALFPLCGILVLLIIKHAKNREVK